MKSAIELLFAAAEKVLINRSVMGVTWNNSWEGEPVRMPVLFIGHGSPMNIVLKNDFTDRLVSLGRELPKPRAIVVVSAHWLTVGTYVTCVDKPKTIFHLSYTE